MSVSVNDVSGIRKSTLLSLNDLGWIRAVIRKFTDYLWGKHSFAVSVNCSSNFCQVTFIKKELSLELFKSDDIPWKICRFEECFEYGTSFFEWVWTGIFPNEPHPHFNKGIPFNDNRFGAFVCAGCWTTSSSLLPYKIRWVVDTERTSFRCRHKQQGESRDVGYDENMAKVWSLL
jgi:hypothetical protein